MNNSMPPDEIRQIPNWTRKYAQNRALPRLVLMLGLGLIFFGLFWAASAAGQAHRAGQTFRFGFWVTVAVIGVVANLLTSVYFSIPSRFTRVLHALDTWLYKSEGRVTVTAPACDTPAARSPAMFLAPLVFGGCILGQVVLSSYIPSRYQQPVSALYVVPFLLFIVLSGKSVGGLAVVLWPVLYALHAVLLLAGAPILFADRWEVLNMLLPTIGYGALSFLAAHLYSRVALRRLRHLG